MNREAWRVINGRSADSALTGEFLFELYQRHNPFLNPFRFRQFKVEFAQGYIVSSTPAAEWLRVARRFGAIIADDRDGVWRRLDTLLARSQPEVERLERELSAGSPEQLSRESLATRLVECVYVPLGDIYEVNLVQVEIALSAVAQMVLAEHGKPGVTLSALLPGHPTAAGDLDRALAQYVLDRRSGKHTDLDEVTGVWTSLGAGYGARMPDQDLERRLTELEALPVEQLHGIQHGLAVADQRRSEVHDPLLDKVLQFADLTAKRRDANKARLGGITNERNRLVAEVSRRARVPMDLLSMYLLEELVDLIRHGSQVDTSVLDRRRREGITWRFDREVGCGVASAELPSGTLRGEPASPGKCRGRAVVIDQDFDHGTFNPGDVLVAPGTDFDLALVMRRAGGIVTEEDGVLSHAAVIARELSIPCVVGLSGATRTITTGDLLDVDGSSGAVRRIERRLDSPEETRNGQVREYPDRTGEISLNGGEQSGRKSETLALLGEIVPVPKRVGMLSADLCRGVLSGEVSAAVVAGAIASNAEKYEVERISLRSSSPLEDGPERSAAGIFTSALDIDARAPAVHEALVEVLRSSQRDHVRKYFDVPDSAVHVPIAVLVSEYLEFAQWGTAAVLWEAGLIGVELHDGNGATNKNFTRFWLNVADTAGASPKAYQPSVRSLVARVRATCEWAAEADALVEFGISPAGDLTLLQWRPLPSSDRYFLESQ